MANTVVLHFTEKGQGIPVVLVHGYPLSSAIWAEQQQELSDHYRVITPDLRGYGGSPAPEGVYTMEILAADIFALLDSLNIKKAVILGHSMGGYATLAAWRLAPERILALGMICSQARADTDEGRQGRFDMAEKVFMNGNAGSVVVAEAMLPKLFSPQFPAEESATIEQIRTIIVNTRPSGIIGALKGMAARPDSLDLLPEITVPTLVLAGDKDQLMPLNRADEMAAALPNAMLVNVEDAGHLPMLEQPRATTMAIRNFLGSVHTSSGAVI